MMNNNLAYKMDPSDNDIKAIVIAQEELGMPKVKDVMKIINSSW